MKGRSPQKAPTKFKTDLDISKGTYRERELERWVPDADAPPPTLMEPLAGSWDQFKVNEEKFGVVLTFDEHLYTTRIDKLAPDYAAKAKRADAIAREIEASTLGDRHVLEERGVVVDDLGADEEDKYLGVDRRGDELMAALRGGPGTLAPPQGANQAKPGRYATPRQRAAEYHNDPAIVLSSATIKKRDAAPAQKTPTPQALPAPLTPAPLSAKPSTSQTLQTLQTLQSPPAPKTEEQFRLNAQLEINSLREFAANFKIPHKMPNDLLPILAKDKLKQEEIMKKQKDSPKKTSKAFNPKAAAFTPLFVPKLANLPGAPPAPAPAPLKQFHRLQQIPQQRNQLRQYNQGQHHGLHPNGQGPKRHHQILAAEFFGDALRVPTKQSQQRKIQEFKFSFSLFITARKRAEDGAAPVYERTFQTPPTWNQTLDQPFDQIFPPVHPVGKMAPQAAPGMMPGLPFVPQGIPVPYPGKYPMSPAQHPQAAAAMAQFHQQQQQYQMAMMYQQQFPPGGAPMPMYGAEPPYMTPQFIPPPQGYSQQGSGQGNGGMYQGGRRYQKNRPNH